MCSYCRYSDAVLLALYDASITFTSFLFLFCSCFVILFLALCFFFFFSSRRRHTRFDCDWSSDVCSSDLAMHRALNGIVASNGSADLSAALALAAGAARAGEQSRANLFSDGNVQPLHAAFANRLPFPIEYHRVGVSGENVGLTSLVVRASAKSRAAFLRVQNFGQQQRSLTVEWRSDAGLIGLRPPNPQAGQTQGPRRPVPDT